MLRNLGGPQPRTEVGLPAWGRTAFGLGGRVERRSALHARLTSRRAAIRQRKRVLQPAGDGLVGEGERRADGAEGLGFIFQGAQFDRRGILFVNVLNDLAYGG